MAQSKSATNGTSSAPTYDDLAAQIDTLKSDISALTELMGDYGRARKEDAAARLRDAAEATRDKGYETAAQARAKAADWATEAEEVVRRQPALAMGIAAGLGFLVGALSTRR